MVRSSAASCATRTAPPSPPLSIAPSFLEEAKKNLSKTALVSGMRNISTYNVRTYLKFFAEKEKQFRQSDLITLIGATADKASHELD